MAAGRETGAETTSFNSTGTGQYALENTQSGVFGPRPALASRITGEYLSVIGTWTYAGSNAAPEQSLYRELHRPFPAPEFLELTFDDKGTGEFRGDYRTGFAVNDSLVSLPRVKFRFAGDAEVVSWIGMQAMVPLAG